MNYVINSIFLLDNKYYYIIYIINTLVIIIMILSIINYKYFSKKISFLVFFNIFLELLFNYFFIILKSPLLMFITKLFQFDFSLDLNEEIYLNKRSASLLLFYILWTFILCLFSILNLLNLCFLNNL